MSRDHTLPPPVVTEFERLCFVNGAAPQLPSLPRARPQCKRRTQVVRHRLASSGVLSESSIDLTATRIKLAHVNSTQFLLVLPLLSLTTCALIAQSDWDEPFPPHRIADDLYYVGSKGFATYLITTTNGHILINSSFER